MSSLALSTLGPLIGFVATLIGIARGFVNMIGLPVDDSDDDIDSLPLVLLFGTKPARKRPAAEIGEAASTMLPTELG